MEGEASDDQRAWVGEAAGESHVSPSCCTREELALDAPGDEDEAEGVR
jgi:hypothetical protein